MNVSYRWSQISIILITLGFSSCFNPPDFPDEPEIEFRSLEYIDYADDVDSMLLRFDFEDGDGDIGLSDDYFGYPYHRFNVVVDSFDSLVSISDSNVVLPFYLIDPYGIGEKTLFSETDNRPLYSSCDYYYDPNVLDDTIFIQENEYNNNFYIDILKRKNGVYSKFYFNNSTCDLVNFNSRIPIFDSEHDGKSLSGTITYYLSSIGWANVLTPDTFKIRFYIYDRALHKSNVVESPEYLFQDIIVER